MSNDSMDRILLRLMRIGLILLILWKLLLMPDLPVVGELTVGINAVIGALVAVCGLRLWSRKLFSLPQKLLLAGFAWLMVVNLSGAPQTIDDPLVQKTLQGGILAFLCCFPAGTLLEENSRGFIRQGVTVWCLPMALLAVAAVAAAYGGWFVQGSGSYVLGISASTGRLEIFTYCTVAAQRLTLAMLLLMMSLTMTKQRGFRVAAIVCVAAMIPALCLTDGRNATLSLGIGAGLLLSVLLLDRCRLQGFRRIALAAGVTVCVAAVTFVGLHTLSGVMTLQVSRQPKELVLADMALPQAQAEETVPEEQPEAEAEETEEPEEPENQIMKLRSEDSVTSLSGRDAVWRALFAYYSDYPLALFTGTAQESAMHMVRKYVQGYDIYYVDMHNIYLQILLVTGLPGFVLAMAFVALLVRAAWRVFFAAGIPLWRRMLPVPVIVLLISELLECQTRIGRVDHLMMIFYLFAGMTFAAEAQLPRGKKVA